MAGRLHCKVFFTGFTDKRGLGIGKATKSSTFQHHKWTINIVPVHIEHSGWSLQNTLRLTSEVLIGSGIIAYLGTFTGRYRVDTVKSWAGHTAFFSPVGVQIIVGKSCPLPCPL